MNNNNDADLFFREKKTVNDNIIYWIAYFIFINANLWTDFKLMNIYV